MGVIKMSTDQVNTSIKNIETIFTDYVVKEVDKHEQILEELRQDGNMSMALDAITLVRDYMNVAKLNLQEKIDRLVNVVQTATIATKETEDMYKELFTKLSDPTWKTTETLDGANYTSAV